MNTAANQAQIPSGVMHASKLDDLIDSLPSVTVERRQATVSVCTFDGYQILTASKVGRDNHWHVSGARG